MTQPSAAAMLAQFVHIFCGFWAPHRVLFRRIHGIAAIDPEFGAVIQARNRRRLAAATRIVRKIGTTQKVEQLAAVLAAFTSFEFFEALAQNYDAECQVEAMVLELAQNALLPAPASTSAQLSVPKDKELSSPTKSTT